MKTIIVVLFLVSAVYAETVIDKDGKWKVEDRKNGVTVGALIEPSTTYLALQDSSITDSPIYAIFQEIVIAKTGKKLSMQIGSASGLTAQDIVGLYEQGYSVKKVKG